MFYSNSEESLSQFCLYTGGPEQSEDPRWLVENQDLSKVPCFAGKNLHGYVVFLSLEEGYQKFDGAEDELRASGYRQFSDPISGDYWSKQPKCNTHKEY